MDVRQHPGRRNSSRSSYYDSNVCKTPGCGRYSNKKYCQPCWKSLNYSFQGVKRNNHETTFSAHNKNTYIRIENCNINVTAQSLQSGISPSNAIASTIRCIAPTVTGTTNRFNTLEFTDIRKNSGRRKSFDSNKCKTPDCERYSKKKYCQPCWKSLNNSSQSVVKSNHKTTFSTHNQNTYVTIENCSINVTNQTLQARITPISSVAPTRYIAPTVTENTNKDTKTLERIAERLSKGKQIFAAAIINGEKRYGEVRFSEGWIFINALTLKKVDTQNEEDIIWMCDFRNRFREQICSFFTFSHCFNKTLTVILELDKKQYSYEFLGFCTEENGGTFKNCPYYWKKHKTSRTTYENLKEEISIDSSLSIKVNETKGFIFYFGENMKKSHKYFSLIKVLTASHYKVTRISFPFMINMYLGKFFKSLKFPFLFPQDLTPKVVQESGIAVKVF